MSDDHQFNEQPTEAEKAFADVARLRASHDALLGAARTAAEAIVPGASIGTLAKCRDDLEAAIARAESK